MTIRWYHYVGGVLMGGVLIGGLCWYATVEAPTEPLMNDVAEAVNVVDASDVGLTFAYKTMAAGYSLSTLEATGVADSGFVRLYTLATAETLMLIQQPGEASELPPTIGIAIYRNVNNETASVWVNAHAELSNLQLASSEINRDSVLAGANAVAYTIDGVYPTQVVVVAHGEYIYVFLGAYLDQDDQIRDEFNALLQSVVFVPVPGSNYE